MTNFRTQHFVAQQVPGLPGYFKLFHRGGDRAGQLASGEMFPEHLGSIVMQIAETCFLHGSDHTATEMERRMTAAAVAIRCENPYPLVERINDEGEEKKDSPRHLRRVGLASGVS